MIERLSTGGGMEPIPILFNHTIESVRRIGARGGKACARNRRTRQNNAEQVSAAGVPVMLVPIETTAQAIAGLDAQFHGCALRNGAPAHGHRQ